MVFRYEGTSKGNGDSFVTHHSYSLPPLRWSPGERVNEGATAGVAPGRSDPAREAVFDRHGCLG